MDKAEQEMLAEMLAAEMEEFDPGTRREPEEPKLWTPRLNATQQLIFDDGAENIMAYGPKYTGKSIGCEHKVTRHCYEEWDALAWVLGNSYRTLALGVCHDLTTLVLPAWKEGNRQPLFLYDADGELIENPHADELMDDGIGLEYSGWKTDPHTKDLYLKIKNKFGGYSRIQVISIQHAVEVEDKVKGPAPSMVYLEESTNCQSREYFKWPRLQLGRRRGIIGPQQYLMSCNPEGPSNWVYHWGWESCVAKASDPRSRVWPHDPVKPGIRRSGKYSVYFVPYLENRHNVKKENREAVEEELKHDDIERRRLIGGEWVERPSGEALFKQQFDAGRHIHGDAEKKRGLVPVPGHPIVVSMDWGSRSVGIVFSQMIETDEGTLHLVFDEITYYLEMVKTSHLAGAIMEKMRFWNEWLRGELKGENDDESDSPPETPDKLASWCFWFITGDDATTNYNPTSGSIEARDLEDKMREKIEEDPQRYAGIREPQFRGCPRPRDSVGKRVDLIAEELMENRFAASALCEGVRGMFFHLIRDDEKPSHPAKGNRWIHIFDGLSYAVFYRRFILGRPFYDLEAEPAVALA